MLRLRECAQWQTNLMLSRHQTAFPDAAAGTRRRTNDVLRHTPHTPAHSHLLASTMSSAFAQTMTQNTVWPGVLQCTVWYRLKTTKTQHSSPWQFFTTSSRNICPPFRATRFRIDHEGPKVKLSYNCTIYSTSALDGGGWSTPRSGRVTPGKDPVWMSAENLAHTGIRSPDRPAYSESLYRLSYPDHTHFFILAMLHFRILTTHNITIT